MKQKLSKSSQISLNAIIGLVCIFAIWFLLSIIDFFGYIFRDKLDSLFYFRAWEKVSNYTGINSDFAKFKPWIVYKGSLDGDLLNLVSLKSHRTVKKKQLFIVDEYGFRNTPHFLDKPIDAVVIGTSFVGGAALDQSELISTILTNKYGIRTYNYTNSMQEVWEDPKFRKNPPKFVVYLGTDADIISTNWFYTITQRNPIYRSIAFKSYDDWNTQNKQQEKFEYDKFAADLRNFSITRVFVNNIYQEIINFHRSWKDIVSTSIQDLVDYDPQSNMLYFQSRLENPILGSKGMTTRDIKKAIQILNETNTKLQTRNMTLVIAAMPSKAYAEMKKYRDLPDSKSALAVYNKTADEEGNYINIDLLKPLQKNFSNPNFHAYFQDDSHWNGDANEIAANAIAEKICDYLPEKNKCHQVLNSKN